MRSAAILPIAALILTQVFAQSLRIAMVTKDTPGAACAIPTPGSSFPVDTPKLYVWFSIDNAISGDRYRAQWVMPDGRIFSTIDFNPTTTGNFCFWTSFEPAATNRLIGLWSALIIRGGNQVLRSVDFQLTPGPAAVSSPTISQGGIAEPWTYQPGLSPGGWATLYGTNLAGAAASWQTTPGELLPTALAGVTVRVDGTPVPLAFVSPDIVNFLAPGSLPSDHASVTVERNGALSPPVTVSVRRLNPAIYSIADTSRSPAAFFVTATRAGAAELVGNSAIDSRASRGAIAGESIDLYVTGLGRTARGFPTDRMFSGAYAVLEPLTIDLNGVIITPEFAGLTSPGLYLVRFTVPQNTPPGDQPIRIKSGEFSSAANVFLRIEDAAPPLTLESFTFSAATVTAGQTVTGTITLSGPAPALGVDVEVIVDSGSPSILTIAPNKNSVSFPYTAPTDSTPRTITFLARWSGMERSATLGITARPITLESLTLSASSVVAGQSVTGTITLSGPAPASGVPVQVSINSASATTITVPANRGSVAFTYTPAANSTPGTVTIFARWNGTEKSATITITAPPQTSPIQNYELTLNGSAVIEGRRTTMKVLLNVPDILPRAQVDTFGDFASGIILYVYYFNPVVTGDSVTFSSVNGLGSFSNINGGVVAQTITGGSLTVTVQSAANGTPVTGTIQFRTATKNISAQFTGTVTASTKLR